MTKIAAISALLIASMTAGCILPAPFEPGQRNGPTLCTTDYRPGIVVAIYDADTGEPAANQVVGYATDGAYADTLMPHGFTGDGKAVSLQGAHERPGTYSVLLKKSGYTDWLIEGVFVEAGECHVKTVSLEARLERVVDMTALAHYR